MKPLFKTSRNSAAAIVALSSLLMAGLAVPAQATTATPTPVPSAPPSRMVAPSPSATPSASANPTAPAPAAPATATPTASAPTTPDATPAPTQSGTAPAPVTSAPAARGGSEDAVPVPFGAIGAKWRELGGAAGPLGEPTANEKCDPAGLCVEPFTSGEIYYTPATGAKAVLFAAGKTGPQWKSKGGIAAFGYPIADEKCVADGCVQRFSRGTDLTWSAAGGHQQVWTRGAIGAAVYQVYGGYAGTGYPTSAETCTLKDQGCAQNFGQLKIMWSAKTGAFGVWAPGAIGGLYKDADAERGKLGFPTSKETCGLKAKGCYQNYQGGAIVWSPASGAHISQGAMRRDWASRGYENGGLGYPTTEEVCGLPGSGCRQEYQGGTIFWSQATGARSVNGAIKGRYQDQGGVTGYLGYPIENEICSQPRGGCYQWFQGGVIFWSPATGAQPVRGGMKTKYESMGWHLSYLGYPAAPEVCTGGECAQAFQGGYITWTPTTSRDYGRSECSNLNEGGVKYTAGGAKHVLLTYAADYGQSYAAVVYCKRVAGTYVVDWRTDGRVGASGFKPPGVPSGPTRYNFSPTGSYSVTEAFGLGNPGTALPYKLLNPNSRWGGNPWTATYNKYFESTSWVGWDENMWYFATGRSHDYRQGAVLNYNRPPDSEIVQDAGFAIFLHEHKVPTAGCISLDDWAVEDYLRKSVPGDRIIMGVARDIFR
ncbi:MULTISPECIES: hypothetical protein [unclassified Arthrobacter]|uniref:hypothetical protein n=1 Tax=unclassified Arthrobacter TaxID=235627 RepID=UPI002E0A92A1|nr:MULTISPECIES: hypothetical protein [unclassified Arthrobacter]MEC5190896.1 uncharacterized protein with LGFP repeats [Arthrobacter sp. MP_M4]MEC5202086.1 uncharacterized protein with LGFP repeats [Arthrobacter sp. MP_M7]